MCSEPTRRKDTPRTLPKGHLGVVWAFSALLDFGGGDDSYSLERKNNSTETTQPNPEPEGSGFGLFIDR